MKKFVVILAALLLIPSVASAAKWSVDLSDSTAREEGFASIVTNGIGVPTQATIVGGGGPVTLDPTFEFGSASGTFSTGSNLAGLINANLTLRVTGPDGTVEGPVTLIPGADVNVNALQRQFGDVAVGSTAAPRNILVTNDGTAALRVANVLIRGAGRSQFQILSNGCRGVTLQAGQRCAVSITFAPTAAGAARALAVVNSSDASKRQIRIQLRGTGN